MNILVTSAHEEDMDMTTKIPALDTVGYIIIGVSCAAAVGCLIFGAAILMQQRKKNINLAKINPDSGDMEEKIIQDREPSDVTGGAVENDVKSGLQWEREEA